MLSNKLFSFSFSATCLMFCVAQVHAQINPALSENLMHKSGLWKQIASMPPQILSGLDAGISKVPSATAETKKDIVEAAQLAFNVEKMRKKVQAALSDQVSANTAQAVLIWFDSDFGRAFTKAEELASEKNPQEMLADGLKIYQTSSKERQAMIEQLVISTSAVEFIYNLTVNASIAMMQGASKAVPGQTMPEAKEVKAMFSAGKPEILKQFSGIYQAAFSYTYKDLNDQKISKYLEFLNSADGQKFGDKTMVALDTTLSESSDEFGRLLAGFAATKGSK